MTGPAADAPVLRGTLDGVVLDGSTVSIALSLHFPATVDAGEVGTVIESATLHAGPWSGRAVPDTRALQQADNIVSLGHVLVPVDALPAGQQAMSLELVIGEQDTLTVGSTLLDLRTGVVLLDLYGSHGLQLGSRPRTGNGTTFQFFTGPDEKAWLRAERGSLSGLRWSLRNVVRDLRALVHREPLSTWKLIRLLTIPLFWGRRITIIGERFDTASDNGFHVFRALRTSGDGGAYYVIDADSPQRGRVATFGHVLDHGSFRHKLHLLHARTVMGSQNLESYLLPRSWSIDQYRVHLAYRLPQRRVALRHGVTLPRVGTGLALQHAGLDLVLCSVEPEREQLRELTGLDSQLALTGLPRFDGLVPTSHQGSTRDIVIMPTWRRWLVAPSYSRSAVDPGNFVGSDYQLFYDALLAHPRLREALDGYDASITFFPHYETASHFASTTKGSPRIGVLTGGEVDLQETLNAAAMLVTDYSSVQADAAYLGIPVVYSQFDEDRFYTDHYRKGWFDTRTDGFGPVTTTVEGTVDEIIRYLAADCVREPFYSARTDSLFVHRDRNNTARVLDRVAAL